MRSIPAAAKALGWTEPLGKRLCIGQGEWGPVIGVVDDFHIESLRHAVKPLVLMINRWRPSYVAVRLGPGDFQEGLALVRKTWNEFAPHQPFEYTFLDDDYQALYRGEERVGRLFIAFSVLATVVASLGLLGLASIVAWPIAYFLMDRWLRGFAYDTFAAWWMSAIPAALALGIALLTVSAQSGVVFENGALFYQRTGPKYRLSPLTETLFAPEGLDSFRLEFVMKEGKAVELIGLYDNGERDSSPRSR